MKLMVAYTQQKWRLNSQICQEFVLHRTKANTKCLHKHDWSNFKDRGINFIEKVPELKSIKTSLYNSPYNAIGAKKILKDLKKKKIF